MGSAIGFFLDSGGGQKVEVSLSLLRVSYFDQNPEVPSLHSSQRNLFPSQGV